MIYTDVELTDGLYNINNGKLFKYKAKGGSVRVHEIKRLVRCKDCKYIGKVGDLIVCRIHEISTRADDYCSRGERSEE